jgi:Amt family ammonium transporter
VNVSPLIQASPAQASLMQAGSESTFALIFVLLLLTPLAIAGVALINAGLGRSRSAAQSLLGCMLIVAAAVIAFVLLGSGLAGAGLAGHNQAASFILAGKPWNWIGRGPFVLDPRFMGAQPEVQLGVLLECLAAGFVGLIPWGAGADRWRTVAGAAAAVVLAVLVFPLLAHWTWGGGWLAQLGTNFGLGEGFVDGGGAATIHVLGGLSALAVIWIAGPRKGKFPREGLATAMPGHNVIYVLFGCLVALVGWLAWNAAGALLWQHAALATLAVTAINTLLAASGALASAFAVTWYRFGKPDASLCANGWLAGLVTSSACAAVVTPGAALFTGLVAGIFTPLLVEVLELALSIDDPTGALSVHGAAGLWGLFAAGLFAPRAGQLLAQLVGMATLLGVFLPLVMALFVLLNRLVRFRVDSDGERLGMDLHELGGGAYPEFVVHRDESYR